MSDCDVDKMANMEEPDEHWFIDNELTIDQMREELHKQADERENSSHCKCEIAKTFIKAKFIFYYKLWLEDKDDIVIDRVTGLLTNIMKKHYTIEEIKNIEYEIEEGKNNA